MAPKFPYKLPFDDQVKNFLHVLFNMFFFGFVGIQKLQYIFDDNG